MFGIRKAIKQRLKAALGRPTTTEAPVAPVARPAEPARSEALTAAAPAPVVARAPVAAPEPAAPERVVAAAPEPVVPEPVVAPEPVAEETSADDVVGGALTMEAVQMVLDEMVRPALQADGGDISLIGIENDDVLVRLVGSCSSCPSSIATMKLGVERLLQEEFPMMRRLVQVDEAAAHEAH